MHKLYVLHSCTWKSKSYIFNAGQNRNFMLSTIHFYSFCVYLVACTFLHRILDEAPSCSLATNVILCFLFGLHGTYGHNERTVVNFLTYFPSV